MHPKETVRSSRRRIVQATDPDQLGPSSKENGAFRQSPNAGTGDGHLILTKSPAHKRPAPRKRVSSPNGKRRKSRLSQSSVALSKAEFASNDHLSHKHLTKTTSRTKKKRTSSKTKTRKSHDASLWKDLKRYAGEVYKKGDVRAGFQGSTGKSKPLESRTRSK